MRAILSAGLMLVGGVVLVGAVAALSSVPRPQAREEPDPPATGQQAERFEVTVTPEMRQHSRIRNLLYFSGSAWGWGVLLYLLQSGWSKRMAKAAGRLPRSFLRSLAYAALFIVAAAFLSLPIDFYAGYLVPHQFGLSNQSLVEWTVEGLKQLGVGVALGAPLIGLALLGIRKLPRGWWLAVWAGAIPIAIFLVVLSPLVIEPLFNEFKPLEDRGLEARLLDLAGSAGIENSQVFEVDKSRQTKTMNAYVTGLGPSRRIVIWDTLLAKMDQDEVVFVMGHEMGHYVLRHLWWGLGFGFAVMFGVSYLIYQVVGWGTERFGSRWGFSSPSDPAAVPWLLLVLSILLFLLSPLFAGYSRRIEHRADIYGLELTHLNEAAASAFVRFAEDSKVDPRPHPFVRFWRYSHPPLQERIEFALAYRPWESEQSGD